MAQEPGNEGGFTLVETLVAFTIAALSLTAIYQALSTGMLSSDRADDVALFALEAQSKFTELGTVIPLEATDEDRPLDDEGRWTMKATPVSGLFGSPDDETDLFDVELTAHLEGGRELKFRAYKLRRAGGS